MVADTMQAALEGIIPEVLFVVEAGVSEAWGLGKRAIVLQRL